MFLETTTSITDWLLPIGLGLLVGFFIATRRKQDPNSVVYLEAEEFRQNMRKGQLIDMRPQEEWKQGKINGSRNFPKREVLSNLFKIRADQAVFLYANKVDGQVKSVAKKLVSKGYQPVYVLKEGFNEWPFTKK